MRKLKSKICLKIRGNNEIISKIQHSPCCDFIISLLALCMKRIMLLIAFSLFFATSSNAACDDPLTEGVDYSNCRFSDAQDLQGSYLPNSNLSFASFIQVNFDKSIMMNSNLSLSLIHI
mgnify:FL=1